MQRANFCATTRYHCSTGSNSSLRVFTGIAIVSLDAMLDADLNEV